MKIKVICFALLVAQCTVTLSKPPHTPYDDNSYHTIKTFLAQYKRSFTLLDIDAEQGEYSFNTAQDFPDSVCVMIEADSPGRPNKAEQLLSLCNTQQLHNILFLNKLFTANNLRHLSECEHFDVILIMNGLHIFEDWRERFDALLNMGDNIIVSVHAKAQHDKDEAITNYIIAHGGELLQSVHDPIVETDVLLYLIRSNKKMLRRKTWLLPPLKNDDYVIESSFSEKKLIKKAYWPSNSYQTTHWIAGINLLTFKMCNGAYPSQETLNKSLFTLKSQPHTDWMINNMVIQGSRLAWIDVCDLARQSGAPIKPDVFSEEKFQEHEELLSVNVPEKIEHFFWFNLIRVPITRKNIVHFFKPFLPASSIVFDIQPSSEQLLDVYLGHGAKVICFDVLEKPNPLLEGKFENDVIFANKEIMKNALGDATLDNMISLYRRPHLCNIHLNEDDTYTLLQSLSTPIPYLVFRFNTQLLPILKQSLFHLASIGYTQFNFSPRNIPVLGLNTNVHIGSQEQWVTAYQLLQEIDRFSRLDSKKEPFWGYIYARY